MKLRCEVLGGEDGGGRAAGLGLGAGLGEGQGPMGPVTRPAGSQAEAQLHGKEQIWGNVYGQQE